MRAIENGYALARSMRIGETDQSPMGTLGGIFK